LIDAVFLLGGLLLGGTVVASSQEHEPLCVYSLPEELPKGETYDKNLFAVTLQGIVNRDHPRLYMNWFAAEPSQRGVDVEWLRIMTSPGRWLSERRTRAIGSFDDLVDIARERWEIDSCIVWDPDVHATANLATTLAGILNVPAASPALAETLGLQVILDLRSAIDYEAYLQTDAAMFADDYFGRNRAAHQWLLDHYLKDVSKDTAGYLLDGYGRTCPGWVVALGQRDLLVAERALVFDLSPWERTDPQDKRMLDRILDRLGGRVEVIGLFPWPAKYSGHSGWWRKWDRYDSWRRWNPPGMTAPAGFEHNLDYYQMAPWTEWEFISVISAKSSYLNPAHWGIHSGNTSVHRHYKARRGAFKQTPPPTRETLVAKGYVNTDGTVAARHYMMLIVGDMDNFAWVRNYMRPSTFWDPELRRTEFNWDLNPADMARIPDILEYLYETRTPTDHFMSPQTGMGYIFPQNLAGATELSWFRLANKRLFQKMDYKATFAFDRFTPQEGTLETLADIAPDGIHYVVDHSPFSVTYLDHDLHADSTGRRIAPLLNAVRPTQILDFNDPAKSARAALARGKLHGPEGPSFVSYWVQTTSIADKTYFQNLKKELDRLGNLEIVDHRTFAYLYRLARGGSNDNRATLVPSALGPSVRRGTTMKTVVEIRNDGWNAWDGRYAVEVQVVSSKGNVLGGLAEQAIGTRVESSNSVSAGLSLDLCKVPPGACLLRYRIKPPPGAEASLPFPEGDSFLQAITVEP